MTTHLCAASQASAVPRRQPVSVGSTCSLSSCGALPAGNAPRCGNAAGGPVCGCCGGESRPSPAPAPAPGPTWVTRGNAPSLDFRRPRWQGSRLLGGPGVRPHDPGPSLPGVFLLSSVLSDVGIVPVSLPCSGSFALSRPCLCRLLAFSAVEPSHARTRPQYACPCDTGGPSCCPQSVASHGKLL